MKIRFCEHNKGVGKAIKILKAEFPDANIKRKDCIEKCSFCKKSPFALFDGKPVNAIDSEELVAKIRTLMKQ
jgi:uncharacterized protein YuzB (UPF0349 family)